MAIVGTAHVACPQCHAEHDVPLVQSINARSDAAHYTRLLAGELNRLDCPCGKRVQLAARLVFHDPDRDYYAQVVPAGEGTRGLDDARLAFKTSGATGTQRIVPSQNALVEKLKLLEMGLEDWAIEMTKVLLLASETDNLDTILLFDSVDREAGLLHWIRHDDDGPRRVSSSLAAYDKLAARDASRPARDEWQIDRAWALQAVQSLMASAN